MTARSLALALLFLAAPAFAQQRDDLWSVNGTVGAVAVHGNTLYLGGGFTRIGPASGALVAVDPATGTATLPPLLVDGTVYAIVPDGSGGIYVGGVFEHVQGQARVNAARIAGDGTLLPWNPSATGGEVRAITRIGSTVYLGGSFSQVGGTGRMHLAAVDTTGGALVAWNPGANATVYALQAQNGLVYVAGDFTGIASTGRNRACALDPTTGIASAWNPNSNGPVYAMFIRYDAVALTLTAYLGGAFTAIGGQARTNLATVDATVGAPTFSQASAFAPAPNGQINSMRVVGNTIPVLYVGGAFTTIAGQPRNRVASFNGSTLNAWNPNADATVEAVHLSGSTLYLGGRFSTLGGVPRERTGAVNSSGTATTNAWDAVPWGTAYVFATSGSNLWMGGDFPGAGGQVRRNLAAIDLTTGQATPWNPVVDGSVDALQWIGDHLYVGGSFSQIGGQSSFPLRRFDAAGALSPWEPAIFGVVRAIASRPLDATTSLVYVAGAFGGIGDSLRSNLGAVRTDNAAPTGWAPFIDTDPRCLDVDATHVYVGGAAGTQPGLWRVDFPGFVDTWHPSMPSVTDIELSGTDVYTAGFDLFTTQGVVKRFPKNSTTPAWTTYTDGLVPALNLGLNGLEVGGSFVTLAASTHQGVGRLDLATGQPASWDPGLRKVYGPPMVTDLLGANGLLFLAGDFTSVSGKARSGIAALYDGVLAAPAPSAGAIALRAAPNPARAGQVLEFTLPGASAVRVEIHNVAGRLVRSFDPGTMPAGPHRIAWDGRDADGTRLAPGVFFVTLEAGRDRASSKLIRLD